jgi:drug efflux transport system permease protein
MTNFLKNLLNLRLFSLLAKEFREIKRNPRLIVMLVIPPTLNIVLFGFALDPTVTNVRLGVVDESRSFESRELISAMIESRSFQISRHYLSSNELGADLGAGEIDAGLVIPPDYAKQRGRGQTAEVQLIVDAVDSNMATIAGGYAARIIAAFNQNILLSQIPRTKLPGVTSRVTLLYNPGLENSWFIVTGLIGALLVLQGSIVAAARMVREKEAGTVEQLLMTPAEAGEIITAKIAPIFILLTADIVLALTVARLVFGVPFRGNPLLFFISGALCVLSGIGLGTLIATFVGSQQQAQLISFFVIPPLVLLSGATTPIEAMPEWIQPLTLLNPVRHIAVISRGILLKGIGIEVLYPNFLALLAFCVLLVGISVWRFRSQLR